jgi:hypothetical protein
MLTRTHPLAAAAAAVLAFLPTPSRAQDLAPRIEHRPAAQAIRGEPLEIQARIVPAGDTSVIEPHAFVRVRGMDGFTRVALRRQGMSDLYLALIPGTLITEDFAYYLEAFDSDGNGPGLAGSPEDPLRVPTVAQLRADKPVKPDLRPAPQAPLVLAAQPAVPVSRRPQWVTFLLCGLGGVGMGAGTAGLIGYQSSKAEVETADGSVHANTWHGANHLGTVTAVGFVTAGLAFTSAILYLSWPDAAPAAPAKPVGAP